MGSRITFGISLIIGVFLLTGAGCTGTTSAEELAALEGTTITVEVPSDVSQDIEANQPETVVDESNNTAAESAETVTEEITTEDETADETDKENNEDVDANIVIISPEQGAVVASTFPVSVKVKGFTLSDDFESDNVKGEGHIHIWVDDEYYTQTSKSNFTLASFMPGDHTIKVSLQNNDHTDLDPAVMSDAIIVTVPK